MNRLTTVCMNVSRLFAWLGGAVLLCSAVLISLDVIFRALFKITVFESFEISTYAFAIATAFGLAYALASRAHIRIEVAYNLLTLRTRAWLDLFSYGALAFTACVLLYWCASTALGNFDSGARSNSALAVPLAIPQGIWVAGIAWFALVAILLTVAGLWLMLKGGPLATSTLLGVATLQDEIASSTRSTRSTRASSTSKH